MPLLAARAAIYATSIGAADEFGGLDENTIGLTVVETAVGVWSGDVEPRAVGVNPAEFVGVTDPTDDTDGIDTPANVGDYDQWTDLSG